MIIQNWNPEIVVLNSNELSNALGTTNEIGWVTYVKRVKGQYKVSSKIVHEPNYYGGDLFYLKTNNGLIYDYSLMNEYLLLKKQMT